MATKIQPVFYPALTCNLRVLFDEALLVDGSKLPPAQTPDDKAGAGGLAGLSSGALQSASVAGQVTSAVAKQVPLITNPGQKSLSQLLAIVPKQATVELPGYRQAGHFSLTFAWHDFPVDPRAIRMMGVEIFAGAIAAGDYATGMSSKGAKVGSGPLPSMLNPVDASGTPMDDRLLLVGYVDEINVEHSDGTSTITIDGRDPRGILLTSPIGPKALSKLNLDQPIDRVVQAICDLHPRQEPTANNGHPTFYVAPADPKEWPGGVVPHPAVQGNMTSVRLGAGGAKPTSSPQGDPKAVNFWDIITNYCFLVGAIPYFNGRTIIIRPARSIFDLSRAGQDPTIPTPFTGGKQRSIPASSGPAQKIGVRTMVYGRDVATMHIGRKLGGIQTVAVQAVSIDTSSTKRGLSKLITATWPTNQKQASLSGGVSATTATGAAQQASQAAGKTQAPAKIEAANRTAMSPTGKSSEEQVLTVSVPGIKSKTQLLEIAKNLFEEVGRQEIGGSCSTRDLASLGGGNEDPDLLRLRPGDAVRLLVDQTGLSSKFPLTSALNEFARASPAQAVAMIKKRLGADENLARVIVASSQNLVSQFNSFFRVSNVKFNWNADNGLAIDFDFQNYIAARSTVDRAPGGGRN